MQRIPVQLITGFLGAGKTTFLNHLIKERSNERLFVIENEVGKINVDAELVLNGEEDIAGLTAGCLCCSLHDELLDQLNIGPHHILAHDYGDTVMQELLARDIDRRVKGEEGLKYLSVVFLNGGLVWNSLLQNSSVCFPSKV